MKCLIALTIVFSILLFLPACAPSNQLDSNGFPILQENIKEEITAALVKEGVWGVRAPEWNTDTESGDCRYYGYFDGYYCVFATNYSDLTVHHPEPIEKIGNCRFSHQEYFFIRLFKDGETYELNDLYEQSKISDNSLTEILRVHEAYQLKYGFEKYILKQPA